MVDSDAEESNTESVEEAMDVDEEETDDDSV